MAAQASVFSATFDCADHKALADFYATVLGWSIEHVDEDYAKVRGDGPIRLYFQKVVGRRAPRWPSDDAPHGCHLDIAVPQTERAEMATRVQAAGGALAEIQPGGELWTVFIDPAGNPFCVLSEPTE
jgi:predicted enzyme related to lactoylglutathione lyase